MLIDYGAKFHCETSDFCLLFYANRAPTKLAEPAADRFDPTVG
jgi:hypothetical protein